MPSCFALGLEDPLGSGLLGAVAAVTLLLPILYVLAERRARLAADAAVAAEKARLEREAQTAARDELLRRREVLDGDAARARAQVAELEGRLRSREESQLGRERASDARAGELDRERGALAERRVALDAREKALEGREGQVQAALERAASLTREAARAELLQCVELELQDDVASRVAKARASAEGEADDRAREVLLGALERTAVATGQTALVTTITLPNDEWKQRLVGRDGRNLRTIERALGVDLLLDDTPNVVVVSSFDPVRRETARRALERLIEDGRVHPATIDEAVLSAKRDMEEFVTGRGQAAVEEADVGPVPPALVAFLGRLELATSEGQNVRRHSIEVAKLAGAIAAELGGVDPARARRVGLLHDLGRAVDGDDRDHSGAGADLLKRHGEADDVVEAILAHHKDGPTASPLAAVLRIADRVSARRPGARKEPLERYLRRMGELEEIARAQPGVRAAFAVQAGREVRVLVDPAKVSDKLAPKLARDIAREVEAKLTYPGEVQVTVLRETTATETAR